jgi:hypothetical protein
VTWGYIGSEVELARMKRGGVPMGPGNPRDLAERR